MCPTSGIQGYPCGSKSRSISRRKIALHVVLEPLINAKIPIKSPLNVGNICHNIPYTYMYIIYIYINTHTLYVRASALCAMYLKPTSASGHLNTPLAQEVVVAARPAPPGAPARHATNHRENARLVVPWNRKKKTACCQKYTVVRQFGTAKLVSITQILLGFMVDIPKLNGVINQQT